MTAPPVVDPARFARRAAERLGPGARLFRAPGRLNVIGEHVDYSGGRVLPAAIDRAIRVAAVPASAPTVSVESERGVAEIALDAFVRRGDWADHVAAMAFALKDAGLPVTGARLLIASDLPIGAGVSSSAALAVGVGLALLAASGIETPSRADLARIAQASENRYVGAPCGIMDQAASLFGRAGHVIALDCATLAHEAVPIPAHARFLLIDSGSAHVLADGAYAARRADCEAAAAALGLARLADATDLARIEAALSGGPLKRARHVVTEIARVDRALRALRAGDLATLGALMTSSHASLAADMEVSTPELDALAATAQATPGVFGARMMGGGFGGSVIALAEASAAEAALASIVAAHGARLGRPTSGFAASAADGAGEWTP